MNTPRYIIIYPYSVARIYRFDVNVRKLFMSLGIYSYLKKKRKKNKIRLFVQVKKKMVGDDHLEKKKKIMAQITLNGAI